MVWVNNNSVLVFSTKVLRDKVQKEWGTNMLNAKREELVEAVKY